MPLSWLAALAKAAIAPCLLRHTYVLVGERMTVAQSEEALVK